MSENLNLISLTLKAKNATERLEELANLVEAAPENSLLLASELCISGYDFDGFFTGANKAMLGGMIGSFDAMLLERLQEALSPDKFLGFTHLSSLNKSTGLAQISNLNPHQPKIYNEFLLLNSNNVFHSQFKAEFFRPNLEHEIFAAGEVSDISAFTFKGLKLGVLICFELRDSRLWAKLRGCDIIMVPAMWGKAREEAYLSLCKALAIANNCYVMISSSLDLETAGVFLPDGTLEQSAVFDANLIAQIKKNLGLL
ncbi:carbon-nitrogen hydrolase family protein [Campylobacter concisus]|uniref:carbon-nitrogen hydrolase family protein n=1 Tax=Campylobacter concisus TaxID=199 RepID=UPI000CD9E59D|nr:carbon-nitrogen hydrolase family protein [Campylobacter concisus]